MKFRTVFFVLMVFCSQSYGQEEERSFSGTLFRSGGQEAVSVFIQEVEGTRGISTTLALVVRPEKRLGAVFRVEGMGEKRHRWYRIFQNSDHVLETPLVSSFSSSFNREGALQITPTEGGAKQGCDESLNVRPAGSRNWSSFGRECYWGYDFVDQQTHGKTHHTGFKCENGTTSLHLSGRFDLDGKVYASTFDLKEIALGLGLLRSSSEQTRESLGFAAYIERSAFPFGASDHVYILRMKPQLEVVNCWEPISVLVEE